ncbi:TlpA family protein disulfide reductase [Paracoccus sp. p4-l81]|uniref:TlpA family protein disulfide reductase n=1 Tax=unclassified Paracoccus (in: a-proteobacteria) TaxID=2688777 RepID=UPI0035B7EACC
MRLIPLTLALLTALAAPVSAQEAPETLLVGEMKRFAFAADRPLAPVDTAVATADGGSVRLADFKGKPILLNFWATWCAPCRAEMPSLDRLQAELGDEIKVFTLATGRNAPEAVTRFFDETGVTHLPKYLDPRQDIARAMGVFGLPVTVLLDAEGHEVGRLIGDAEWDTPEAIALIRRAAR